MPVILIEPIISGFFVKAVASFDDTLTRVPIIAELTRRKLGKVAFSIGTLLALTVIILIAIPLSSFLNLIPYTRYVIATLMIILALAVYFEIFFANQDANIQKKFQTKDFSRERFIKLVGIGFLISFVTLIDDSLVLTSVLIGDGVTKFYAIIGIYLATLVQITLVIFFGDKLNKFKYKKELASLALVFLAILIIAGII